MSRSHGIKTYLLGAAIFCQYGCLDRLLQATMAPQTVVAESINNMAGSLAEMEGNNQQAVTDIDRILSQHPDAVNRQQLMEMRQQLAGQRNSGGVPVGKTVAESVTRRDTMLGRGVSQRKTDTLRLLPQISQGKFGIKQGPMSTIPPSGASIESEKPRLSAHMSPVRVR